MHQTGKNIHIFISVAFILYEISVPDRRKAEFSVSFTGLLQKKKSGFMTTYSYKGGSPSFEELPYNKIFQS